MKLRTYRTAVLTVFLAVWVMVAAIAVAILGWLPRGWAFLVATVLFAGVFVAGTAFALLVNLRLLRITCPFCQSPGHLASEGRKYTYFVCPQCGEIHPAGPMSRSYIRIGTDPPGEDDDRDGQTAADSGGDDRDKPSS